MKRRLHNNELEELYKGILKCGEIKEQPIRTLLLRNASIIKNELQELYKGLANADKWQEYVDKESALIEKYVVSRGPQNIPNFGKNKDTFESKLEALKEEYAEIIKEQLSYRKDFFENVMSKEVTIDLIYIKETDLPESINLEQLIGIEALIVFDE